MKIFKIVILLLSVLLLCSCSVLRGSFQTTKDAEEKEEVKREMTKEQEEILRTYGLEEEKIAKLKENGMDYGTQSFVDTAVIMLNYLEEKYNEKFIVVGGYIPDLFAHEYSIVAQALEGEYAGINFNVYYLGEKGCRDGYVIYKIKDKACEAIKKLLQEEFPEMQVFADIHGEYGNEVTLDMTGEELLPVLSYDLELVIADPTMTEEELKQIASQVRLLLKKHEVFSDGDIYCVENPVEPNMSVDELITLFYPKDDAVIGYKYSEFIGTWGGY